MGKTASERQRERRHRIQSEGGKLIQVILDKKSAQALQRLQQDGKTMIEAVAHALLQATGGLKKPESQKAMKARLALELKIEQARAESAKALLKLKEMGVEIKEAHAGPDGIYRAGSDMSRKAKPTT